jgi:predicted XRE-type DNA-binding protein
MKSGKLELVRGSGNVFRDLGRENADIEQLKALLAAEILKALDREKLTVRAAHAKTGFAAADFSRVRNADLGRFTADRLMSMLNRLGAQVEVKIRIRSLKPERSSAYLAPPGRDAASPRYANK